MIRALSQDVGDTILIPLPPHSNQIEYNRLWYDDEPLAGPYIIADILKAQQEKKAETKKT